MEFNDKYHGGAYTMMTLNYAGGVISGGRFPCCFFLVLLGRQGWNLIPGLGQGAGYQNGADSQVKEAIRRRVLVKVGKLAEL